MRVTDVSRAVEMDPGNPEYRYRVGLLRELDWEHGDLTVAVRDLTSATIMQPNRADYWSSLGHACYTADDDSCADKAYEKAIQLAPTLPLYQWEIAKYYLLTGRANKSLSHFRRFLELNPDDPTPTFSICLRALSDPELLWRTLLQNKSDDKLKLAFVGFLNESGHGVAAYQFWNEIASSGLEVSFPAVQSYLDQLIASNHIEQASKVWQDLQRMRTIQMPGSDGGTNHVFNGGFEHEPLNSGFDWRLQRQDYLNLDFAARDCYEGSRCLRVDFTVPNNAEYEPIYQIVPVLPNQEYVLTAYARSADIASDTGPRLRVIDPECSACVSGESPASVGTTPWHEISLAFASGPKTRAIRISVWRPRSRFFPMEIQGHFWLDSVSLKPSPTMNKISPVGEVQ